jgi:hypothetical protein
LEKREHQSSVELPGAWKKQLDRQWPIYFLQKGQNQVKRNHFSLATLAIRI